MSNTANIPRLKENAVGLWGNYAQAMAVTAPLGSVVSSLFAGALYAGANLPLVTLLAFITHVRGYIFFHAFPQKSTRLAGSIHIAQTA